MVISLFSRLKNNYRNVCAAICRCLRQLSVTKDELFGVICFSWHKAYVQHEVTRQSDNVGKHSLVLNFYNWVHSGAVMEVYRFQMTLYWSCDGCVCVFSHRRSRRHHHHHHSGGMGIRILRILRSWRENTTGEWHEPCARGFGILQARHSKTIIKYKYFRLINDKKINQHNQTHK